MGRLPAMRLCESGSGCADTANAHAEGSKAGPAVSHQRGGLPSRASRGTHGRKRLQGHPERAVACLGSGKAHGS